MKTLAILLTVLFVGLQLSGYIAWSWWLVLSPILVWWVFIAIFAALVTWAQFK